MKIFLTEMSYERSKALDKIGDLSLPLLDNIYKVILYPTAQEYNHWVFDEMYNKQIAVIFTKYSNVKKQGKLKYKDYYKVMVEEPFISKDQNGSIKKYIFAISQIEDKLVPKYYPNNLSIGELNNIYYAVKAFLEDLIKYNMENLISKKELDLLVKKYLINI